MQPFIGLDSCADTTLTVTYQMLHCHQWRAHTFKGDVSWMHWMCQILGSGFFKNGSTSMFLWSSSICKVLRVRLNLGNWMEIWCLQLAQVLRGHRNPELFLRQQACFWDYYVLFFHCGSPSQHSHAIRIIKSTHQLNPGSRLLVVFCNSPSDFVRVFGAVQKCPEVCPAAIPLNTSMETAVVWPGCLSEKLWQ